MSKEKRFKKPNILDPNLSPATVIMGLVWPMIIEEILSITVNYVDTAMVGSIGTNATASVAVSSPIIGLINGLCIGLCSGFGVVMSRRIGEDRKDDALKVMQQALYFALFLGFIMTGLFTFVFAPNLPRWMHANQDIWGSSSDYIRYFGYSRAFVVLTFLSSNFLRGQGDTQSAMKGNILANLSNCLLNFLFIYPTRMITVFGVSFTMWGWGKGVAGAAIATSVANVLNCCYTTSKLFTGDLTVHFKFPKKPEKPDFDLYKFVLGFGAPNAAERMITSCGMMVTTSLLASVSNQVVAAHSLCNTTESIVYMSIMGYTTVATTLVAQWLGNGNKERAELLGKNCIKFAVFTSLFTTSILFIFAPKMLGFFSKDPEVIAMGTVALRIQCMAEPFAAAAMTSAGILRGAGDVKIPAFAPMCGMWGIRIPFAMLLVRHFGLGLIGVWIPMAIDWLVRFTILFTRYKSGKWKMAWKA